MTSPFIYATNSGAALSLFNPLRSQSAPEKGRVCTLEALVLLLRDLGEHEYQCRCLLHSLCVLVDTIARVRRR